MQLTILGTACMVPTKERNVSGYFLQYKNQGILFDCGEGTQRQMNIAGIKRTSVKKILVSHWHGDHISGVIGLIQTISSSLSPPSIEIYGPKETKERFNNLMQSTIFEAHLNLKITEITTKKVEIIFENEDFVIQAGSLDHNTPCLGYAFIEKDKLRIDVKKAKELNLPDGPWMKDLCEGKPITHKNIKISPEQVTKLRKGRKLTYIADSRPNENSYILAQDADILLCEATYASSLLDKAEKYKHMTAKEAALIASQANVKKLYLTHFSQRYKTTQEIERDAREIFDNSICTEDFMKINI